VEIQIEALRKRNYPTDRRDAFDGLKDDDEFNVHVCRQLQEHLQWHLLQIHERI